MQQNSVEWRTGKGLHLEQADTGLLTRKRGVSEPLGLARAWWFPFIEAGFAMLDGCVVAAACWQNNSSRVHRGRGVGAFLWCWDDLLRDVLARLHRRRQRTKIADLGAKLSACGGTTVA